jgi:hypothetical protein
MTNLKKTAKAWHGKRTRTRPRRPKKDRTHTKDTKKDEKMQKKKTSQPKIITPKMSTGQVRLLRIGSSVIQGTEAAKKTESQPKIIVIDKRI